MTNYASQMVVGPGLSPFVSKDKGDFSNRANCAGAQFANNLKTLAQDVVVLGGALGGIKLASKSDKFAKPFAKITDGFAKLNQTLVKKLYKTNVTPTWIRKLKGLSPKTKAMGAIAALAISAVSYISCKHLYKMGQIDQKYSDKAAIEKHQNSVL